MYHGGEGCVDCGGEMVVSCTICMMEGRGDSRQILWHIGLQLLLTSYIQVLDRNHQLFSLICIAQLNG